MDENILDKIQEMRELYPNFVMDKERRNGMEFKVDERTKDIPLKELDLQNEERVERFFTETQDLFSRGTVSLKEDGEEIGSNRRLEVESKHKSVMEFIEKLLGSF